MTNIYLCVVSLDTVYYIGKSAECLLISVVGLAWRKLAYLTGANFRRVIKCRAYEYLWFSVDAFQSQFTALLKS
jgi:hypothetical protein